jgi:hypothetical protein
MKGITAAEREALIVAADPHGEAVVHPRVLWDLRDRGLIAVTPLPNDRWWGTITEAGRLVLRLDAMLRGVAA